MPAFIDARCRKCDKKIGWFGEMVDMPNCPKCGAEPDRKNLAESQAKMEEFQRLLATRPRDAKGAERRKQRITAGLLLGQAATKIGCSPADVSAWENGRAEPTPEQEAKIIEAYGLDPIEPKEGARCRTQNSGS